MLIVCSIAIATFIALYPITGSHIMGADESVYASEARAWIDGSPADQFEIYRPIAMPVFGYITMQFSDDERAFRIVGVIFGAITPVIIFLLFWRLSGIVPALLTSLVVVLSPLFLRQAPLYLNDIPSAALLLAVLLVLYVHYETRGKSTLIYFAAPLAALAFYMRYAAATPLALVAIISYALLLPRFARSPVSDFSHLLKTGILAAVLFAPHVIHSLIATHEVIGILRLAGKAAHRVYVGEGLLQYISWIPGKLGGIPLEIAFLGGVIVMIALMVSRRMREQNLGLTWAGSIGLASFILTGLLTHAEPRYVFFPLTLLAGTGIGGLYALTLARSQTLAYSVAAGLAVVLMIVGTADYREQYAFYRNEEIAPHNVAYMQALAVIRNASGGNGCEIWTQMNRPRASWYTKCHLFKVVDRETFHADASIHQDVFSYSIVGTRIPEEQITPENAAQYGVELTEIFRRSDLPVGDLIVYKLTKNLDTPGR